jgi:anthraniloyl-CoA monooxygenase
LDTLPPMFTPFTLRGMTLPNRVVVSPMCMYSAVNGTVGEFQMVHLGSRAVGGAGLVLTEMTDVCATGRISPGCAGLWNETHRDAWARIVDFVHGNSNTKIGVQLAHAGRKGSMPVAWERADSGLGADGWDLIAPSAIPFNDKARTPRAMTQADIDETVGQFARSAAWSAEAGFDMIELHMGHGYLISSFMSPLSNKRNDAYGGDLKGRMKFPLEVFRAVRGAFPKERPISCRISAVDWQEGGNQLEDGIGMARMLLDAGCDIIDVSSGNITAQRRPEPAGLYQTPFSEAIRKATGKPTITVGNIRTAADMNEVIAAGRADLCAMARQHLYDPYFAHHAAQELGVPMPWPNPYKRVAQLFG